MNIFQKLLQKFKADNRPNDNSVNILKSWYEERYEKILIQRNVILIIGIICLISTCIASIVVFRISISKKFDPFVVQIEDETGTAKIINPTSTEILSGNEALSRYFIKKYITARETYNPADFGIHNKQIIRLLSSYQIYIQYLGYIRNKNNDPVALYGDRNTTYLTVKSWSRIDNNRYILRFSITETTEQMRVFNKIAIAQVQYIPMELSEEERDTNPIGFQIVQYRVDDDNS